MAVGHDALEGLQAVAAGARLIGAVGIECVFVRSIGAAKAGQTDRSRRGNRVLRLEATIHELIIPRRGDEHGGLAVRIEGGVIEVGHSGAPAGAIGLVRYGGHPLGDLIRVGKELAGKGITIVGPWVCWFGEGAHVTDEGRFAAIEHGLQIDQRRMQAERVTTGGEREGVVFSGRVEHGVDDAVVDAHDVAVGGISRSLRVACDRNEDVVHIAASTEENADEGFVIVADDIHSTRASSCGGRVDELELGQSIDERANAHGPTGTGSEEFAAGDLVGVGHGLGATFESETRG